MAHTLENLCRMISGEDNHSRQLNKIINVKYLIVQLVIKSAELTLELVHGVVVLSHSHRKMKILFTRCCLKGDPGNSAQKTRISLPSYFPASPSNRRCRTSFRKHSFCRRSILMQINYISNSWIRAWRLWRWIQNVVRRHFKDVSLWSVSSYQTREHNNDNHESGEREKYSPFVPRRANKHD